MLKNARNKTAINLKLLSSAAILACASSVSLAQPVLVESRFNTDAEGWALTNAFGAPVLGGGFAGRPYGYIRCNQTYNQQWWIAPAKFRGSMSDAMNGYLSFDVYTDYPDSQALPDITITGGNPERTIVYRSPIAASPFYWTTLIVPMQACAGWHIDTLIGATVSSSVLANVLSNVTDLRLRAYRSDFEHAALDNVLWLGPTPAGLPASTFDSGAEDWSTFYYGDPGWSTNGALWNYGGYASWYFAAPAKFVGNLTAADGGSIRLRVVPDPRLNLVNAPDDPLVMIWGRTIRLEYHEYGYFNEYLGPVPLYPTSQWIKTGGGQPTAAEFHDVMSCVQRIAVRGYYGPTPPYMAYITNFDYFNFDCTPNISLQPTGKTVCVGQAAVFTAGSYMPGASFRWYRLGTAPNIPDTPLSDGPLPSGSIVSGTNTSTLTISPVLPTSRLAAADAGNYFCRVYSTCGFKHTSVATLKLCNLADLSDQSGVGGPDGRLTGSDVLTMFQYFFADCTAPGAIPCNRADIIDAAGYGTPDGKLSGSDVIVFFQSFFQPTP